MTPDQQFARLVKFAMAGFAIVFAYFLLADLEMPLTPQAMATRGVVKIAPQISGRILTVNVHNNQTVEPGDLLFSIDPAPYELALQNVRLNLEQTVQNNAALDASIAAARADVESLDAELEQKQREAKRLTTLAKTDGVSRQLQEEATTAVRSARAQLDGAKASLQELVVSRGDTGDDNLSLRQARNALAQAQLNMNYTQIRADDAGIITNLQLEPGTMVNSGSPVLALVADKLDVIADFREKTLRKVSNETQALVVFDAAPGRLYTAQVSSRDAGVSAGQFSADGTLATPAVTDRWVRDAQRIRLHFDLSADQQVATLPVLAAGSRATVQLLPENPLFRLLASLQIRAISLLHFIY